MSFSGVSPSQTLRKVSFSGVSPSLRPREEVSFSGVSLPSDPGGETHRLVTSSRLKPRESSDLSSFLRFIDIPEVYQHSWDLTTVLGL